MRFRRTILASWLTGIGWIALAPSASAVDGVTEINQARAVVGGVTPSDTPGLPVTIDTSGTYRLTGNLVQGPPQTDVISISAPDVTLDLNGFKISGPTVCTTDMSGAVSCTPLGSGSGIRSTATNTTVPNGTVTGLTDRGIRLDGAYSRVERLRARGNGVFGIEIRGPHADVHASTFSHNGGAGIGISGTSGDSRITDNVTYGNGGSGIQLNGLPGSLVRGNISNQNFLVGILVNTGDNTMVIGNTTVGNGNRGISFGTSSGGGYAQNIIADNAIGTVNGGVEMGTKLCDGNTTCP